MQRNKIVHKVTNSKCMLIHINLLLVMCSHWCVHANPEIDESGGTVHNLYLGFLGTWCGKFLRFWCPWESFWCSLRLWCKARNNQMACLGLASWSYYSRGGTPYTPLPPCCELENIDINLKQTMHIVTDCLGLPGVCYDPSITASISFLLDCMTACNNRGGASEATLIDDVAGNLSPYVLLGGCSCL